MLSMKLTKEEKKKMKGLKLISTPWDHEKLIEVPIRSKIYKRAQEIARKEKITTDEFIQIAIREQLTKLKKVRK